ncbi:MgtC/SapB family protein [Ollibium composti]|jgi:uncharacterized membrane protein (DUF4010 family)|uniref:MgtC/SapB family protein n=1 Tax=Ollibium composti TaxID=2675109 RepID=A0ABY2Q374_9HYPH|nr:MgtC/SapB family protein [Mesorhizobium composti]THF55455.1 MgtC/SapB family protein [Mesorhizobium composti]
MDALLPRLGLALAIGLLVGLERGWRERDAPDRSRTAGIRTYAISGLLGGVFAALAESLDAVSVLVAGFLGFAAVFASFKAREAAFDDDFSATGVIAGLGVFALGALAVSGDYQAAAGGGAALAGILASREILHELLKRLTWVELRSALVLSVMTAIILPLLPNRPIDPWGGLNPWEIWFFTVLVAAISYLGYIAVRVFGTTRGLIVSALGGALVSSTAVTLALCRAAKSGGDAYPLAGAALLAAMISVARVCLVVAVVEPGVLASVGPAALGIALGFGLYGALLIKRQRPHAEVDMPARSPFDLAALLMFALAFAIVATVNAALATLIGAQGLVATSAVSGLLDVDVAALSALRLVGTITTPVVAGHAVLAAILVNSLARVALAIASSPFRFWISFLLGTAFGITGGATAFILVPSL